MQRNFQNNLTEDFLASLFYLNRSYLSQIFRKRTGMKFVDYLNQLRIEKAKELLTSTDLKMYQIAKRVGYDNPKYFFRIFKKKTGLTPEQYRKPATT
jgi:two-component system response regulator YesN